MTASEHDAAGNAARYLAGELSPEERRALETHMMNCDTCWTEMVGARAGRALAESLREPAPQAARELLRSIAAAPPADSAIQGSGPVGFGRRSAPGRWLHAGSAGRQRLAAAALVVLVGAALTGVVALLSGRPGSDPLRAAAAEYYVPASQPVGTGAQPPVVRIGDLVWTGTDHTTLADQRVTVYRYADSHDRRLVMISSTESFPRADNARDVGAGPEWIADIDGAAVLCADADGLSWLVVAGSQGAALAAGAAAGLA